MSLKLSYTTLPYVELVLAIHRNKQLNKAADALGVTDQAVRERLKTLERKILKVKIFDRTRGVGAEINESGLPLLKQMLDIEEIINGYKIPRTSETDTHIGEPRLSTPRDTHAASGNNIPGVTQGDRRNSGFLKST